MQKLETTTFGGLQWKVASLILNLAICCLPATINSWQTDKDDEEGTYLLWALPEALMLTQTGNN